ncbi:L-seryl-tRNA(Sec) selenium transferase [Salirhabdus sp. Marseille-P4669]|uniref:L-seryl-tRNA(Sec) selenium transferase n=1 Tax=Salirhabdus sp. Marseille-P4669 TaxID=2042310 RepID=UPI000C79B399|nr:L-seryl-tRNA(Sec) selenium transferase [Salirhabdus sp. Marseille-P4669]
MNSLLRSIPPVHEIQREAAILDIQKELNLTTNKVTETIQQVVNQIREMIIEEKLSLDSRSIKTHIIDIVVQSLTTWNEYTLKRVINGTGTVLHTNLGRARLSEEAAKHVVEIATSYSNLEYDIQNGKRGSRHAIVEDLIKEVTGAEAAIVVNNNAAAVYFILRCFAKGSEVIVSRGELVEIGGSFRVSSIMEESDAKLVEVGTTNKTNINDYEKAISDRTTMLLKVHTSNFKIVGFTKSVERKELSKLAEEHGVLFYEDLGSGALYNFSDHHIGDEPVVKSILKEGPHLISFSGDKLLGGPQAGIIAGKKELIDKLKQHQLARVLRVDKMSLAALEVTLKAYVKDTIPAIPTVKDMLKPKEQLHMQAMQFLGRCRDFSNIRLSIKKDMSMIGGGTMPTEQIETYGITLNTKKMTTVDMERNLRVRKLPVICRFVKEELFIDFRTLSNQDIDDLFHILTQVEQELQVV